MKDNEIIESIRNGNREKPIKYLYKEFPVIKAKILASGGNKEIAEEVFNDALLLLMEKVSQPSFELSSKLSTFLFGIARFLWKNELRRQNKKQDLEWEGVVILSEEFMNQEEAGEERYRALETIIASLSKKCQDILERLYYKDQSMQEIANALGFSSENSAKTQKYKCMEQAIKQASTINLQSNRS